MAYSHGTLSKAEAWELQQSVKAKTPAKGASMPFDQERIMKEDKRISKIHGWMLPSGRALVNTSRTHGKPTVMEGGFIARCAIYAFATNPEWGHRQT